MSLFSSLQLASNALQAQQIGLQVVGQNIANVNTPNYTREEANFVPSGTQRLGNLLIGLGVSVDSVTQVTDEHLNARLRTAVSDSSGGGVQTDAYTQLEQLLGSLQGNDLGASMNNFFTSIGQILGQPDSVSTRNSAVLQGQTLANQINQLSSRAQSIRTDLNNQIVEAAPDVNRLIDQIRQLNVQIATTEGGSLSKSQAVGLRDQRNDALNQLSQLVNITTYEQPSGAVNVFVGGDYLVFEGTSHHVDVHYTTGSDGFNNAQLNVVETNSPLQLTSGKIAGLTAARDNIVGGFLNNLDSYANTLAFEFNKLYSSGQGLSGYSQLTSERGITDPNAVLDAAGLANPPVNGSFDVLIHNKQTGLTQTTHITVDLNGLDEDTSYSQLVSQLDNVDGLSAAVDSQGRLVLNSDSSTSEFAFANDTSGTLAALGINTFFTGTSASTIGVSSVVVNDPSKFAASKSGIDGDTDNAVDMAAFLDRKLDTSDGKSIGDVYGQFADGVAQGSALAKSTSDGYTSFQDSLQAQQLAISGVNIDEETIKMLSYQRAYQASARVIKAINDMLDTLTSL